MDFYDLRARCIDLGTIPGFGRVAYVWGCQKVISGSLADPLFQILDLLPIGGMGNDRTNQLVHLGNQLKPLRIIRKLSLTSRKSGLPLRLVDLKPARRHRVTSHVCLTGGITIKITIAAAVGAGATATAPRDTEDQNIQDCQDQSRTR